MYKKKRYEHLKSLGPIDRKFHGHGETIDGFLLYEYIIKQFSSFCKYTSISVMKKFQIKQHVNSKQKVILHLVYG